MAGDMYRKPRAGAPLNINARLIGQFIDVARGEQRDLEGNVSRDFRQADIVRVKNSTASAVAQYGIMGIDAPLILPTDNEDEFKRRVLFSCVAPLTASHKGKTVVLQEPLAAGAIGKAVIAGATQVKITGALLTVGPNFAELTNNDTAKMTRDPIGSAKILWAESGSAERWAIIRVAEGPPPTLRGKLDGTLSYQGSQTMSVWWYNGSAEADTTDNITVYDFLLSSGQTIASGKQVIATLDVLSGRYYVAGGQCA